MKSDYKNEFGKYNGNEAEYALRALDSETPENRNFPWVTEFEDEFCKLTGSKHAIAVNLQPLDYMLHWLLLALVQVMKLFNLH